MVDVRNSLSKDLSFGNKTVIPLMQSWTAEVAYVYGERSQTLATALGLEDANNQYSPFGYLIKVLLPYTPHLSALSSWESLLSNWYGIKTCDVGQKMENEDLLVVLDVNEKSSPQLVSRAEELMSIAIAQKASVLVVTKHKQKLPKEIISQVKHFTGSVNSYWKIFACHTVTNMIYNRQPRNIYLVGEGLRIVSSAIGALDVLARFDESNSSLAIISNRVKVDQHTSLVSLGKDLQPSKIFTSFGLSVETDIPNCEGLEISDRQVLITPV